MEKWIGWEARWSLGSWVANYFPIESISTETESKQDTATPISRDRIQENWHRRIWNDMQSNSIHPRLFRFRRKELRHEDTSALYPRQSQTKKWVCQKPRAVILLPNHNQKYRSAENPFNSPDFNLRNAFAPKLS